MGSDRSDESSSEEIRKEGADGPTEKPPDWSSTDERIDSLFDQAKGSSKPAAAAGRRDPIPRKIGSYSVEKLLGEGGFGSVYLASDDQLKRRVAIKVAGTGCADLLEDARKAAALNHDGIVTVFGVEEDSAGSFYVVMEYLEGGSLADRIDAGGQMSAEEAAAFVADVADAVQHAHENGIVHRDLKPANILLDRQGRPHITDFGLAVSDSEPTDPPGRVCGTAKYMSPEQIRGRAGKVDARTDVWSLGVILYEILAGNPPFVGHPRHALFQNILDHSPKPLQRVDSRIPQALEEVVLKCLEKDRDRRHSSAAELAVALRQCVELATRPDDPRAADRIERGQHQPKPKRRSVLPIWMIGIGILLAALTAIFWRHWSGSIAANPTAAEPDRQTVALERQVKRFDYAGDIRGAYRAWKNADVASALDLLSKSIPRPGEDDLRGFEWYYLQRLCEGSERTLRGHAGRVYGVSFSADGRQLATCGEDGTVRIWESATGEFVKELSQIQKTPTPNPSSATADLRPEDGEGDLELALTPPPPRPILDPKTGEGD